MIIIVIEETSEQGLNILSHELNESMDSIIIRLFNNKSNIPRIIWFDDNQQTIAVGSLWDSSYSGSNRFTDVHEAIVALYKNSVYLNRVENDHLSRVFGGFSYFNDGEDSGDPFKISSFILPKYIFFKKDNFSTVVLMHSFPNEGDGNSIEKALIREFNEFYRSISPEDEEFKIPSISNMVELTNKKEWISNVEEALRLINATRLEKVVIARSIQFLSDKQIRPFSIFKKLHSSYPNCFNFYFELDGDQVFLGASPELLIQKNVNKISTMALAGTIKRGSTREEDVQLANELLSSNKDRKEHQIVVQQIIDNLKSFVDIESLKIDNNPHIHKIHNVQHLRTNISAQLKGEISLLDIIDHLHPTPAVGGKPRTEALQFIKALEGSRGWYASPLGYIKSNLDGKFIVGLRSALIKHKTIHAFAGAGIVDASDPTKEWEETKLKFKPFLNALEVNYDIQ